MNKTDIYYEGREVKFKIKKIGKVIFPKRAIKAAFPDREMIGINSCTVVRQHGSLHCCTMQYPQKVDICNNKS